MIKTEENYIKIIADSYMRLKQGEKGDPNALLRQLARENKISTVKARKILITAGIYESEESLQINKLHAEGKTIAEISAITGFKKSTINNLLPYTKGVYKCTEETTLSNARVKKHRERKIMEDPQRLEVEQMPKHGIFFYSVGDLSVGFYIDHVKKFLLEYHQVNALIDAIQAYNCYLFINNGISGKSWTDKERLIIETNANKYKNSVARFLSDNPAIVLNELNDLEYEYQRSILRMSVYFGIFKKWSKEAFFKVLNEKTIYQILEIKQYSESFPIEITQYLKNNIPITADIILANNTINEFTNPETPKYYLPQLFDDKEKARTLTKYIDSENPDHSRLINIINLPGNIKNRINKSSIELAQRLIDKKSKEIMDNISTDKIATNVIIEFSRGEKSNKPEQNEAGQFVIHYNLDTLDENLTPDGVFKCLYTLFGLFDQQNGLTLLAKKTREFSLTDHLLGPKFIKGYNFTLNQKYRAQMTIATLLLYYDYLNSNGIHLEDVLGKGLSNRLKDHHNIPDFGFELPTSDLSYRFKAMNAALMIEDLFDRIFLLGKREDIDKYKLANCPPVNFTYLESFLQNKYLYVTDDPQKKRLVLNLQYLLFSSQHVFYVKKIVDQKKEIRSNLELMLLHEITRDEIPEYDKKKIDFLIKHRCVIEENNCLKPTKNIMPLKEIWDHGCVTTYRTINDYRVLVPLIAAGWLIPESKLLSRPEQNLLSFLYNNANYSDAWALRNYYAHARLTELTEEQHKSNYLWLLYIIMVLEMKFVEDLELLSIVEKATADKHSNPLAGRQER